MLLQNSFFSKALSDLMKTSEAYLFKFVLDQSYKLPEEFEAKISTLLFTLPVVRAQEGFRDEVAGCVDEKQENFLLHWNTQKKIQLG